MQSKIKAIIFDLDGVIIDSVNCEFKAYKEALKETGFEISLNDFLKARGGTSIELLARIAKAKQVKFDLEKVTKRKNSIYKTNLHRVKPYREMVEFIKRIKDCKLGVASSGSIETINPILKNIGIKNLFDAIIASEDITHGKPNPEIFLLAAKKLKAKPSECLVFEDSKEGISAAIAAGMKVVAIKD